MSEAGVIHDYRVDRGTIRATRAGQPDVARNATGRSSPCRSRPRRTFASAARPFPSAGSAAGSWRRRFGTDRHRPHRCRPRVAERCVQAPHSSSRTRTASLRSSARTSSATGSRSCAHAPARRRSQELERRPVRVVVLDIGLPDMDGFDVCRSIRTHSRVPILMLTARDEEPDRVSGLELGADDYVTKPFSPRELLARVRAVLRRTETWLDEPELALGDVVVRRDAREATVAGETVELTSKEFDLLTILLTQPERRPDPRVAARPRVGAGVPGWDANGRHARRVAAAEARPPGARGDGARRRLQVGARMRRLVPRSLRTQLLSAIVGRRPRRCGDLARRRRRTHAARGRSLRAQGRLAAGRPARGARARRAASARASGVAPHVPCAPGRARCHRAARTSRRSTSPHARSLACTPRVAATARSPSTARTGSTPRARSPERRSCCCARASSAPQRGARTSRGC